MPDGLRVSVMNSSFGDGRPRRPSPTIMGNGLSSRVDRSQGVRPRRELPSVDVPPGHVCCESDLPSFRRQNRVATDLGFETPIDVGPRARPWVMLVAEARDETIRTERRERLLTRSVRAPFDRRHRAGHNQSPVLRRGVRVRPASRAQRQ